MDTSAVGAPGPAAGTSLDTYLRQIDNTPLLSAEQERQLALRVQQGDARARDHLVRANLRLVVHLARGYPRHGVCLADLIAEGNLGLLRAVEAFDPAMNTRFSTYAIFWIRQSIRRAIVRTSRSIRLPGYVEQLLTEWRRAGARLHEELGRPPTDDETAARLRLSRRRLALVKKAIRIERALPPSGQAGTDSSLEDLLAGDPGVAPGDCLAHQEELHAVLGELDRLPPRQAAVLRLRFGLGGGEPLTLQQVGQHLGLTRGRVRQIEREALQQLADRLSKG
jgi:RNA polymerase primary sigma factor